MSTQSQQSEIIIKVFIDNKPYEIDCDTGIQDVAWLALSACYLYGQETYPITTYLPIMAKNKQGQSSIQNLSSFKIVSSLEMK